MKKLTEKEYTTLLESAFKEQKKSYLRMGQIMFNMLVESHDENHNLLAESVRGTVNDPFYTNNLDDVRFINFKNTISETN